LTFLLGSGKRQSTMFWYGAPGIITLSGLSDSRMDVTRPSAPNRGTILPSSWTFAVISKRFLKHGEVEIDNNLVENAIRPTAVGKKNWLFLDPRKPGRATRRSTH
jgi:hypothetical protein